MTMKSLKKYFLSISRQRDVNLEAIECKSVGIVLYSEGVCVILHNITQTP